MEFFRDLLHNPIFIKPLLGLTGYLMINKLPLFLPKFYSILDEISNFSSNIFSSLLHRISNFSSNIFSSLLHGISILFSSSTQSSITLNTNNSLASSENQNGYGSATFSNAGENNGNKSNVAFDGNGKGNRNGNGNGNRNPNGNGNLPIDGSGNGFDDLVRQIEIIIPALLRCLIFYCVHCRDHH